MEKKERLKAIAVKFDQDEDQIPNVVAKGNGLVAENIMTIAKQNNIPIYQNKSLANMLMAIELDENIPPQLYKAMAEILAYVYSIDKKFAKKEWS